MSAVEPTELSEVVARNIVRLRGRLGWTRIDMADKVAALGNPWPSVPTIGNIETGRRLADGRRRRTVSVDELFLFAKLFNVTIDDLTTVSAPACEVCNDWPPVGFTCNSCGAKREGIAS